MASEPIEVTVARHGERLADLEEWRSSHEEVHDRLSTTVDEIRTRPTWGITFALTALVGLCSTLLTVLLRR